MSSDKYLGTEFVLTYPTIDDVTRQVLKRGKGCHIFTIDISRAFRHIPIDPRDINLLGLFLEGVLLLQIFAIRPKIRQYFFFRGILTVSGLFCSRRAIKS